MRSYSFLNSVSDLLGVENYISEEIGRNRPRVNSHMLECLAYTQIKIGSYSCALKSLAELHEMLESDTIEWLVQQRERGELVRQKLLESPAAALEQLAEWEAWTRAKLGLQGHM